LKLKYTFFFAESALYSYFVNLLKPFETNHYQFYTDMKKNFYRLLSFAVLATIIISCGGETNPLIKEAKDGIKAKNYDAALASLDQALVEDSSNANAYYYKGVVYSEMAQNNPQVQNRKDSYSKMRENLLVAMNMFEVQNVKSVEAIESQLLIDRMWGTEHNMGVAYAVGDTTVPQVNAPLEVAVSHFENAVIINPDSIISIDVLAEVHRMSGDYASAAVAMEKVIEKKSLPDAIDYDRLASYYLQLGDYSKAENVLIEGTEVYPDSVSLVQKLADTYTNQNKNDEAIQVLRKLIDTDPSNPLYHLVLSTQIYNIADEINQEISQNYDSLITLNRDARRLSGARKTAAENTIKSLFEETQNLENEADVLIAQAIEELKISLQYDPQNQNAYYTLGVVNQNKAASLFEKRNATEDNNLAAEINEQANEYLREAMTNYEKAVEIDSDNQNYWRSLFQVYTTLGMMDKAEAAMEKAGM
jgi:tetratricopeptide (TPR) repeat protein|tara:strand:- start:43643 stop:45067 length:1425 start_codon:yes stop_codon:yes gene_type:complete